MKQSLKRRPGTAWSVLVSLSILAFLGAAEPILAQFPKNQFETRSPSYEKSRSRQAGTIHLEDFTDREVKVKIDRPVGIYTTLSGANWLGNLLPVQEVTLLAVSDRAFRVRGRARQGQVAGWIGKYAVSGVSEEMIKALEALHARKIIVDELVANRQVAMGMTICEVEASIGSPDRRHAKTDPNGRIDIYEYVKYDRVPHTTTSIDPCGHPIQTTVWIKVETGRMTVTFQGEVVSSIEESEGVDFAAEAGRIVPPPIFLF